MATSARTLSQQEYAGLPLIDPYATCMGDIWPGFQTLIWGEKGSGKSTQMMLLAASLVPHAVAVEGSVMVLAAEEGVGVGVKRRLDRVGIPDAVAEHMMIEEWSGMEDLKASMREHDVKWLVVDSISVVDVASLDLIEYCRDHGIGTLLVAHARKGGWTYKGNSKVGHEVDAVLRAYRDEETGEYMIESRKNRATDAPPPDVKAPAGVESLYGHPSAQDVMRENPDCSVEEGEEQSDRCKAIMASLRSEGEVSEKFDEEETEDVTTEEIEEAPDPEETDTTASEGLPKNAGEEAIAEEIGKLADLIDQNIEPA